MLFDLLAGALDVLKVAPRLCYRVQCLGALQGVLLIVCDQHPSMDIHVIYHFYVVLSCFELLLESSHHFDPGLKPAWLQHADLPTTVRQVTIPEFGLFVLVLGELARTDILGPRG